MYPTRKAKPLTHKYCWWCEQDLPIERFFVSTKGWANSLCKKCTNARDKIRYQNDDEYRQRKTNTRMKLQESNRIDASERFLIFRHQDGVCAICGAKYVLKLDHCHTKKCVRGLLCDSCNTGLGKFKEDPQRLRKAADYLEKAPDIVKSIVANHRKRKQVLQPA